MDAAQLLITLSSVPAILLVAAMAVLPIVLELRAGQARD